MLVDFVINHSYYYLKKLKAQIIVVRYRNTTIYEYKKILEVSVPLLVSLVLNENTEILKRLSNM